jgi:hypothetical protein
MVTFMSNKGKIYIAGPMTGYPEFNFPAFHAAAAKLRKEGWIVFNPAEKDEEIELDAEAYKTGDAAKAIKNGFDFREAYLWDIERVIEGDAIYMLPGWEKSAGACGEIAVARAMQRHYPNYQIIIEEELRQAA